VISNQQDMTYLQKAWILAALTWENEQAEQAHLQSTDPKRARAHALQADLEAKMRAKQRKET